MTDEEIYWWIDGIAPLVLFCEGCGDTIIAGFNPHRYVRDKLFCAWCAKLEEMSEGFIVTLPVYAP